MKNLDKFLLMKPLLKMISGGKFFCNAFSWLFRILAILCLASFFYISINFWIRSSGSITAQFFIFALIFQILLIAYMYAVINILLVRAEDIDSGTQTKDYTAVPVSVIVIKSAGEIFAVSTVITGILGAIAIWIIGDMRILYMMMPQAGMVMPMNAGGGAVGGIITFIASPIIGFIYLAIFYSIAELVGALVDIARNTSKR